MSSEPISENIAEKKEEVAPPPEKATNGHAPSNEPIADENERHPAMGPISEEDESCFPLTFLFAGDMLSRGYAAMNEQVPFTTEELLGLPQELKPDVNYQRWLAEWHAECERTKALPVIEGQPKPLPSVYRSLRYAIGGKAYVGAVFRFISDAAGIGMPFILRWLIDWFVEYFFFGTTELWRGFLIGLFLVIDQYVQVTCNNWCMYYTIRSFLKARDVLNIAIYEKAMKLEATHRLSGKIMAMHSTDCAKIVEMGIFCHGLWMSPILIVAALIGLYFFIGGAGLLSLAVMIVLTPINGVAANKMMFYRGVINQFSDERMRTIRELLSGIRIIKFMNWEKEVERKIQVSRDKELETFVPFFACRSVMVCMIAFVPQVVNFVVFASAYGFGRQINAKSVFPVLAMLNILRVPLAFLPLAIGKVIETNVSLTRIQEFLIMEEHEDCVTIVPKEESIPDAPGAAVAFVDANIQCYNENDRTIRTTLLHDVNLKIPEGKLTIVVGSTGSGKSTLINAIASEGLLAPGGRVYRRGEIAFVAQEAWIMNNTVRGNIVLNRPFDEKKYLDTVNACQLMSDFEQLSGSDMTEIGDRGINLSGGQKQRIAFARAVYSGIPLVLMDDPLSAVDAHVRVALFDEVILGALANRTRVLVTHYVEYLPQADYIVVIQDKRIAFAGTYDELQASGSVDIQAVCAHASPSPGAGSPKVSMMSPVGGEVQKEGDTVSSPTARKSTHRDAIPQPKQNDGEGGTKLISEEHQVVGGVPSRVLFWYVKNSGAFNYFWIVVLFIAWRTAMVIADEIVSFWSTRTKVGNYTWTEKDYLMWFGIWIAISGVLIVLRQIPFVAASIRAARISHTELVGSVIRAPSSFFDTTPVGRMINRFSKDTEGLDLIIPENLNFFYQMILVILGAFAIIIYGAPYMAIVLVVLTAVFMLLLRYYTATNRALKRLDGINRSPVIAIMSESMGGLTTLRAYGIVNDFSRRHVERIMKSSRSTNATITAQRWLGFRVDLICFFINISVTYIVIGLLTSYDTANKIKYFSGMMLGITTSVAIGGALSFLASMSADLEAAMSSVERVEEYVNDIPHEREVTYDEKADGSDPNVVKPLPEKWPSSGTLVLDNVSLRYREKLPLVLKSVSCTIQSGEKVGIVGRTGSGKSTIMLALFRLIELAEGSISFDGVNIANIDTSSLRSAITIIPQDPLLFQGTIRSNLDPFDQRSDEEVLTALRTVGMLSAIQDKVAHFEEKAADPNDPNSKATHAIGPLDCVVDERGSNFSVGQRQLLCLARAIMKKSRVLLLDEATASVDFESDELIQHTVRTEFSDCTVLTIAHRLSTVMDYDKILALDGGVVQEFDYPKRLLQNTEGYFYSMVSGLGEEQFQQLSAKAKEIPEGK